MSSTNKTTNYELSQYIGTDKPTYLGDYNSDMLKIDTQMKVNATAISTLNSNLETVSATATSALSKANTADGKADTAGATATSALSKALQNEANLNKFNLSTIQNLSLTSPVGGTFQQYQNSPLKIARDSTGSIFKLYGAFELTGITSTPESYNIKTSDTGLRPSESYIISPIGTKMLLLKSGTSTVQPLHMRVNTDGTIDIIIDSINSSNVDGVRCIIMPCLYFNTNFGD